MCLSIAAVYGIRMERKNEKKKAEHPGSPGFEGETGSLKLSLEQSKIAEKLRLWEALNLVLFKHPF